MSISGFFFGLMCTVNDKKRNEATAHPAGVDCCADIPYGSEPKWNLLNVYIPQGTTEPLPTIVSIHGGGYIYGDKEVYHHYCADLARRGFAVVNFNYRLAPKWRFPAPLEDTNAVMKWLVSHAAQYHMDPKKVFLLGDSAGAQIASQYAAIVTNPNYAALFPFTVPEISIRALGLNCGNYNMPKPGKRNLRGMMADYLGRDIPRTDPRLQVVAHISGSYPPAHITTAYHDFLRDQAQPMYDLLAEKGIHVQMNCYGSPAQKHIGHVFHVDIRNPEATDCNDTQCAFFRTHL